MPPKSNAIAVAVAAVQAAFDVEAIDLVGRLSRKLLSSINPSPENDCLYEQNDASIRELADRIEKEGLLEPLVLTEDGFILSGHRRYEALELLGRTKVPVRIVAVRRSEMDRDDYISLLRRFNRSREKTVAEKIRETLVDLDEDDAYENLQVAREKSVNHAAHQGLKEIVIEGSKQRHGISDDKAEHRKYILQIVEDRKEYWPLSVRGVHYPLLNFNFIRGYYHPRRTDHDFGKGPRTLKYANDDGSYDATSNLITRLRLNGEVPWVAFDDPTRPVEEFHPFKNAQKFVTQEVERLLDGYWRDLLQSQPNYIEVLVEKNTVFHMAKQVTKKYQITTRSARGLCSIDSFHDIAVAFEDSGKERLILIVLSDFDPEGELIPHDAGRRLRDDFKIPSENLQIFKAGVTREQISQHKLPSMNFAKETSSNYDAFVERNGGDTSVYELEALDPKAMLSNLDNVIRSVLDIDLYNAELRAERGEAAYLEATKKTIRQSLKGLR